MKIKTLRLVTVLFVGGLFINGMSVQASGVYKDSLVGITAALDQYIEDTSSTDHGNVSITEKVEKVVEAQVANEVIIEVPVVEVEEVTVIQPEVEVKYPQFVGIAIPSVEDSLNIRAEASEESERLGKLPAGAAAQIIEQGEVWSKIVSGAVTGYVKNEFILSGDAAGVYAEEHFEKVATVITETLYVRAAEDVNSSCITMVPEGDTYKVVEEDETWAEVQVNDGTLGYVAKEYVNISFLLDSAVSKEEEDALAARLAQEEKEKQEAEEAAEAAKSAATNKKTNTTNTTNTTTAATTTTTTTTTTTSVVVAGLDTAGRSDIANYALQFVGNPYVYGGTSLTNGADCSGFIKSIYANFGYILPRSSAEQANAGVAVGLDALQPGDLLFYAGSGGGISHVTMYIGGGQVVHASSTKDGIKISNVNYRTPCSARRIAN